MAIRYVISPIVGDGVSSPHRPKVRTIKDPGAPKSRYTDDDGNSIVVDGDYLCVNAYNFREGWVLSAVTGVDFSPLDADPDVVDILEHDFDDTEAFENKTPRQLGWSGAKMAAVRGRAAATEEMSVGASTRDSTVSELLTAISESTAGNLGKGRPSRRHKVI